MAMMGEWDVDAARMTDSDLRDRIAAFDRLAAWPMFKKEYAWTGIFTQRQILQYEVDRRDTAIARKDYYRVVVNDIHCPTRYFREVGPAKEFAKANKGEYYVWSGGSWVHIVLE